MPNKADFQAMADQFCAAFNAGQPAAALGAYSEDACVVSPEGEVAVGHDQTRAYWARQAEIRADLKATVDEVLPLSDDMIRCILSSTARDKAHNRRLIGRGSPSCAPPERNGSWSRMPGRTTNAGALARPAP